MEDLGLVTHKIDSEFHYKHNGKLKPNYYHVVLHLFKKKFIASVQRMDYRRGIKW